MERAAAWAGWPLHSSQVERLHRLEAWLREEAMSAGGLGPNEGSRLETRHLADSLLFAAGWRRPHPPSRLVDLGTGVGLPGIPLAILWPETAGLLVDRAERRVDLARRAVRVLGLENVEVRRGDAGTMEVGRGADLVVTRAVGPAEEVGRWGRRWLTPGGVMVMAGSHHRVPPAGPGEEIVTVPPGILDRPVWLRMMAPA